MDDYSEIAHAAVSNRLCFFTGTGFSKAITNGEAPSWKELLENLCLPLEDADLIKESLFPENSDSPLSLEEAAHIIGIKLLQIDKRIHSETAEIIGQLELKGNNDEVSKFLSEHTFTVVTTNYDKLIEKISGLGDCQSLTPGLPVPRSEKRVKVYHIHGSVDSPENMILTAEDYFKFTSQESYFSRKLSTMIHENAVVILGYSEVDRFF
ncbi:MAG: SIR2 family protein [Rhizobiaceae bacterium]|nr:SIR2 family protein [Rhizobiaceae bacterium]